MTITPIVLNNNIHVWTGSNGQIMVSHENVKNLLSFTSVDDAINDLFLSGEKRAARELNEHKKKHGA